MKKNFYRFLSKTLAASILFAGLQFPTIVRADDYSDHYDDYSDLWDRYYDDYYDNDVIDDDHDELIDALIDLSVEAAALEQAERDARERAEREQAARERAEREAREARERAERERLKNAEVTGVSVSPGILNLTVGKGDYLYATVSPSTASNKGISWTTSNSAAAVVDGNGYVSAVAPGSAIIYATTQSGGKVASATVNVSPAAPVVTTVSSRDASYLNAVTNQILSAPLGGVVTLSAMQPMSFDINVARALQTRPDVGILLSYPLNGHMVAIAIPAGYNLSARLQGGYVDWTTLSTIKDGKIIVSVQ